MPARLFAVIPGRMFLRMQSQLDEGLKPVCMQRTRKRGGKRVALFIQTERFELFVLRRLAPWLLLMSSQHRRQRRLIQHGYPQVLLQYGVAAHSMSM